MKGNHVSNDYDDHNYQQFSLSPGLIKDWFRNNKATLTFRAYGPDEADIFANDLLATLRKITNQE